MRAAAVVIGVLFIGAGCARPATPAARPTAAASTSSPSQVPPPPALPRVAESPVVRVGLDGVYFADRRVIPWDGDRAHGADAKYKRCGPNDLYLVALHDAFVDAQRAGSLARGTPDRAADVVVVLDRDTPYRLLVEVLFTAGQSELSQFELRETEVRGRVIRSRAPTPSRPSADGTFTPPERRLDVSIVDGVDGVAVKTSFGTVAPGCSAIGRGVAVARIAGAVDASAVAACVRKAGEMHSDVPRGATFTFSAAPELPFHEVADIVLAVQSVVPDVVFAVAR